jgi:Zn-dependent metalloprotease
VTNLKSFRFGFIGLLMIFAILMLTFNKSGHEDITLVNIDALVDGDIEPPKNTINSNKRAFKNIQPVTHQSDFNADDAQVLVEKISRVRDERTPPTIDSEKNADLFKFKNQFGSTSNTDIKFDAAGQVRGIYDSIVTASFDYTDTVAVGNAIQAIAEDYKTLFGLGLSGTIEESKVTCSDDICSTKLLKSFHGLPAWDHEITVSSKADTIFAIKGAFYEPALPAPSTYAKDDGMFRSAIATHFSVGKDSVELGQAAELGIAKLGNIDYYAFRLLNVSVDGAPYDVFIDAHSGNVTKALTLIFESSVEASGVALDGTVFNFQANQSGSIFQMIDSRFPVGYATKVYDFNDESPVIITSNSTTSGWPASAVSALAYSKETIDYFKTNHSYDAVDRQGADLLIAVDMDEENAFFSSSVGAMVLGIGAGQIAKSGLSFAASKDVVGHEITHGVVGSTSGLVYEYQSGALNESFSDFFGATIEGDNWLIGEDLLSPSGKALRNMAAPRDAYDGGQPAHFSEYRSLPKSNDQGGVHIYSGIPNRAMYLLSAGLTAESLGTSIGHEKTANLVFKTMIGLTPNASFDEAAEFMASLANVEYPNEAAIYDTTVLAWKSVGLPQEVTTESTISNTPVTAKDVTGVAYLKPYYDTSSVLPEDNWYTVNFQVFLNSKPEFVSEANVQIPTAEYSKLTRPILVNTSDSEFAMIYQRKVDDSFYLWTDPNDTEVLLDDGTNIAGIDASNDSEQIVLSLINTNKIYIVDSTGAAIHEVSIPSTAENGAPTPVTYIDAVRFDPTGRFVVFDFFLCGTGATDCSSFEEGNWSVGILDAVSGSVEFPFPNQPARFDVGFPAFSNLTDRYITLDIVETTADSGVISVVAIYDRETGEIEPIAYTDGTTDKLGAYGYPSFSADDTSLVYSVSLDNLQAMYVTFLDNYKLGEADPNYSLLNPSASFKSYAAALPESSNIPSLTLSTASLDFGDVIQSTDKPLQLCLENKGSFPIDIYDSTMPAGFRWDGDNRTLVEGQSVCSPVIANGVARDLGSFATTFAIIHNGANSPTAVGLSGFVDIDTDEDGIGNNKDSDDDGDDVADDVDAFPLDSSEWIDTDSDGTGNNADDDDDGDGVSDIVDAFPLDVTETVDTDSDGTGNNADTDDDGDSILDGDDAFPNNALYSIDSDSDGMPDAWEIRYGLDPNDASDAASDQDRDGVSAVDEFLAGTIPSGSLDIDGNGQYDALTDGLLLLRGTFGLTDTSLISGAVANDAEYTKAEDVESRISLLGELADVDGNGSVDALTDGLIVLRYLFGLTGDVLVEGVVASDATRIEASDIESYLESLMPAL